MAVKQSYELLKPKDSDLIIWSTRQEPANDLGENHFFLRLPGFFSIKTLLNISRFRFTTELAHSDITNLIKSHNFDAIYCDEVVFYRAIRHLYPKKRITVRFHNCFSRILDRSRVMALNMGLAYYIKSIILARLEREIFRDSLVQKVFITKEDEDYYRLTSGRTSDSETIPFSPPTPVIPMEGFDISSVTKFVWFGGIESHKKKSLCKFIDEVHTRLIREFPFLELHLYGAKTEELHDKNLRVFGHGRWEGAGLPERSNCIYINPDLYGGGVKIKLSSYIKEGAPFITTPFGAEGYDHELIVSRCGIVMDFEGWLSFFRNELKDSIAAKKHI